MNISVWKGAASWQGAARQARWKVPGLLGALAAVAIAIAIAVAAAEPPAASAEPPAAPAQSQHEQDRAILKAIYDATGGENWTNNTNWLSPEPLGSWHGVTVNNDDRVTQLRLGNNGLTGSIPPQLVDFLGALTHLELQNNELTGSIPPFLGSLTSLTVLNLSHNQLTGSIPTQLGNIKKADDSTGLVELRLDNNQLTGEVPDLSGLNLFIARMTLSGNSLRFPGNTIPDWVIRRANNRNTAWRVLDLGDMGIAEALPDDHNLFQLTNLEELYLDNNAITGAMSDDFGDLVQLTKLHLNNNMLTGNIASTLDGMNSLTDLRLNDNQFTGPIPPELTPSNTGNLEILHLHNNEVSGSGGISDPIPGVLGSLPLKELLLHNNDLDGGFDSNLINLVDTMEKWSLAGNNFDSGACLRLPLHLLQTDADTSGVSVCQSVKDWDVLGALYVKLGGTKWTDKGKWFQERQVNGWDRITASGSNITSVDLTDNNLKGSLSEALPDDISRCTCVTDHLATLKLGNNELTGNIPTSLGDLTALTELELNNNELTGSIPSEVGDLTALTRLRLDNNQLTGRIPTNIENLTSLILLWLSDNRQPDGSGGFTGGLDGPIPTQIGDLTNLRWLRLNGNRLAGTGIPSQLNNLTELRRLYLYDNSLPGGIPDLRGLDKLETVLLHNNRLIGGIPDLSRSTNLQTLDLSHNSLSGTIPTWLGSETTLTSLLLEGNDLTGTIPTNLGNLTNLQRLSLHRNQLSGTIPEELGSLAMLQELYLSHNRLPNGTGGLSGNIPMQLGSLSNLTKLWLNDNELTGTVPSQLGNLTNLTELDLSNNGKPDPDNEGEIIEGLTGGWLANVARMTSLKVLRLHKNNFSEAIPTELTGSPGPRTLTELRLDDNEFSGNLPAALTNLSDLERLLLHGNDFDGDIPPEWGGSVWASLEHLSLDHNMLDNQVPVGLLSRPKLKALYLSHNELTGLSGNIPAGDDALSLEELLLEANMLGALPTGVARLSNLKRLSLNHNGTLMVAIPPELAIDSLVDLYLNDSDFTGDVPDAFDAGMTELDTFWLRGNAQLGCVPPSVTTAHGDAMDAHGRPPC